MAFDRIIEEKILEAIEKGEFDNLPGSGKPLDLDAYFSTPADVRLGYSVLKSAGCVPPEVELGREIEHLKRELADCADDRRRAFLKNQIESRSLKLLLLTDANRRSRLKA